MRLKTLAVFAVAATLLACSSEQESVPTADAKALVENRNWLDKWPEGANDRLFVYRFTPSMGGGVYQDRTLFSGRFELFNYSLGTSEIEIRWPDRGKREIVKYRIDAVDGPRPFDLRLTLHGTTVGPSVYYGMRNESGAASLLPWLQAR